MVGWGEGPGPFEAGARTRDARGLGERAVSATALAGCGRGRDGRGAGGGGSLRGVRPGRVTEGARIRHRCPTRTSRDSQVVRESVGSPRFRACWTTRTTATGELTTPWCGQLTERVFGPLFQAREAHEGDGRPREVWSSRHFRQLLTGQLFAVERKWLYPPLRHHRLPDARSGLTDRPGSPTSCRPCARSPTNPSRPGRLIAVTASQDRDETPRTPLGLPPDGGAPDRRPATCSAQLI